MGKESDLWDDSALVKALDQAVTKYKVMHRGAYEEEKVTGEQNENEPSVIEEVTVHEEPVGDDCNDVVKTGTGTSMPSISGTTEEVLMVQEKQMGIESCSAESNPQFPGVPSMEEINSTDLQGGDCSQLLSQYYELEEKRQKVLQQLHQANYWNNQYSAQYSTLQTHQSPDYNAAPTDILAPCCLCVGHCHECAICTCSSGYGSLCPWINPYWPTSQTHQVPEAAMVAAERGVSSLKVDDSAAPNKCEEGKELGKEERPGLHESQSSQSISPETELSAVLNAWYSAGFHTGRYLLEQSLRKGHH